MEQQQEDTTLPFQNLGDTYQSLVWEEPLEKEMATHSSILA